MNLGYNGAALDPADASGSVEGATSAVDDGTIVIKFKGDFDNNNAVNFDDLNVFGTVLSDVGAGIFGTPEQGWTVDINNNGVANFDDLAEFGAAASGYAACPCF
jgi:hypothetical protein